MGHVAEWLLCDASGGKIAAKDWLGITGVLLLPLKIRLRPNEAATQFGWHQGSHHGGDNHLCCEGNRGPRGAKIRLLYCCSVTFVFMQDEIFSYLWGEKIVLCKHRGGPKKVNEELTIILGQLCIYSEL